MRTESLFREFRTLIDCRRSPDSRRIEPLSCDSCAVFWTAIVTCATILLVSLSGLGRGLSEALPGGLFAGIVALATGAQFGALLLLLQGRLEAAQAVVAGGVTAAVFGVVVATGGPPHSIATPALILPPTIFLCLYGVRSGLAVAVCFPVACWLASLLVLPGLSGGLRPSAAAALGQETHAVAYIALVLLLAVRARADAVSRERLFAERETLLELVNEDTLTGIANSRHFRQRLEQSCARIDRNGGRLAVLYLDFDDFKQVNDAFGHAAGDEVLRHIARRLRTALRREDTVARLGGDEFAILVETVTDDRQIDRLVARVREIVGEPVDVDGRRHVVGVSVGRAFYPGATEPRAILECADRDMYKAKLAKRLRATSAA
jgi:diguanylate cyclase (GGDEF)-like protein